MLIDTDILIWYLRGHVLAATFLRSRQPVTISVVTYMELIQGARNKEELQALRKTIQQKPANVSYVAQFLADLRGVDYEELVAQTTANAQNLYQWQECLA